ncbi:winged helix-turn-helix domain-containing protein [Ferrimonas senticii]|uniref:winged helix-turn-helix domain-containing protein n=1 Tax=Ferrimonas senticii TaxID=394566 RepID=UPI0004804D99|nr:winged helix-turn-helix domain-containing protein [Ferrimonas senticii]
MDTATPTTPPNKKQDKLLWPLITLVPEGRVNGLRRQECESQFECHYVRDVNDIIKLATANGRGIVLVESCNTGSLVSDVVNRLNKSISLPIVVISSADFASGRLTCWQAGASQVLAPNCSSEEVLWACRNVEKLQHRTVAPVMKKSSDTWTFDQGSFRIVSKQGHWVRLSRNEAQIMNALCEATNQVVRRDTLWAILDKADWRYSDRTLDVLIARIRAKMRRIKIDPSVILTHYGAGYELRINS